MKVGDLGFIQWRGKRYEAKIIAISHGYICYEYANGRRSRMITEAELEDWVPLEAETKSIIGWISEKWASFAGR